jgi:hypothetical protein
MQTLFIILAVLIFFISVWMGRKHIIKWLLRVRSKLSLHSLRDAIHAADADKSKTGRKNMVIYNTTNKVFEPIQKKQLKTVANKLKNKNNAAQKPGRKSALKKGKTRLITPERIKQTEKKSLYVTQ